MHNNFNQYKAFLGQEPVHENESSRVKAFAKFFYRARIFILLFLSFQWYFEKNDILKAISVSYISYANTFVLCFFLLETIVLYSLIQYKKYFLIRNWPVPLIILFLITLLIFPTNIKESFIDSSRLFIIIWLSIPCIKICLTSLSDNKLSTTIFAAAFFIIFAGTIISGLDPSIKNPWDGIWWAWVTITTVGYGDIVPTSIIGRILAFPLILTGLLLFAAFTANFSALFIQHKLKKNLAEIEREEKDIKLMLQEIQKLNKNIIRLEGNMNNINKKIDEK